jgi:hypothetical protein
MRFFQRWEENEVVVVLRWLFGFSSRRSAGSDDVAGMRTERQHLLRYVRRGRMGGGNGDTAPDMLKIEDRQELFMKRSFTYLQIHLVKIGCRKWYEGAIVRSWEGIQFIINTSLGRQLTFGMQLPLF